MSIMKFRLTAYILLIVSLLVSIRLIRDILKLRSADERLATAENELNKAQIEQMNLKQSLDKVGTPEWQETTFRNTLNLARPGEVVVIVPEAIRQIELVKPESSTSITEIPNWQKWRQVFAL